MSSLRLASRALALSLLGALPAHSQPAPAPVPSNPPPGDLQSPDQASVRNSAYTLPRGMWGLNLGALGIGGGDAYATLGVSYGIGAGLQAEMNLAHLSVGLINIATAWHFVDTRYFDLGARVGFSYGRGKWVWIANDYTQELIAKIDVMSIPVELTASAPLTRWLQLDLSVSYTYGEVFGHPERAETLFSDAQLGVRQFAVRPGARFFVTDRIALELSTKLPVSTVIPLERMDDQTLPFKHTWSFEGGLRSRLAPGFFTTLRLHYGSEVDALYGARLYPAIELEYRL